VRARVPSKSAKRQRSLVVALKISTRLRSELSFSHHELLKVKFMKSHEASKPNEDKEETLERRRVKERRIVNGPQRLRALV